MKYEGVVLTELICWHNYRSTALLKKIFTDWRITKLRIRKNDYERPKCAENGSRTTRVNLGLNWTAWEKVPIFLGQSSHKSEVKASERFRQTWNMNENKLQSSWISTAGQGVKSFVFFFASPSSSLEFFPRGLRVNVRMQAQEGSRHDMTVFCFSFYPKQCFSKVKVSRISYIHPEQSKMRA